MNASHLTLYPTKHQDWFVQCAAFYLDFCLWSTTFIEMTLLCSSNLLGLNSRDLHKSFQVNSEENKKNTNSLETCKYRVIMNIHGFDAKGGCPAAFSVHHDTKFLPWHKGMSSERDACVLLCCHALEKLVSSEGRSKAAADQMIPKDYKLVIKQLKLNLILKI